MQFFQMPKGPVEVEYQLSRCSVAMLAMAMFSNVALYHEKSNKNETCAAASLTARYPVDGTHPAIHPGLEAILFENLNWRWRSLFPLQSPPARDKRHNKPQIPRRPAAWGGMALDWLDIQVNCSAEIYPNQEITRWLECAGVAWGPVIGEDYFESISLLQAVAAATTPFIVVEAGSNIGHWSLKAVKAFRQRFPVGSAGCHVVLIDSQIPMIQAFENLQRNGVPDLCNITLTQHFVDAALLDGLIQAFGHIDLLHVDIQGAELKLAQESYLLPSVRRVHVGTHSPVLHLQTRSWLKAHGFEVEVDYPPMTFVRTKFGPFLLND
ncbi:unnamed protein product, partial [Symbiodinium pilosum]